MLFYIIKHLNFFNFITQYIVVRALIAGFTSFLISLLIGHKFISFLIFLKASQVLRKEGPKNHLLSKLDTPTMGGCLIIFSIIFSILLWGNIDSIFLWILVFVIVIFGAIGLLDDYLKLLHNSSIGLKAKYKYLLQSVFSFITIIFLFISLRNVINLNLLIPFTKNSFHLGIVGFFLISYFVIIGSSNAVNLTDGLDGLAIFIIVIVSGTLGVYTCSITKQIMSSYFLLKYIPHPGIQEVVIFCATICGSGLGFLWFNAPPAEIFMGDVGSLSLGAVLGTIAVIIRQEILFFIISFLFVIETVSVIMQVLSYKLRKKRIFKMAPLHHHFELRGLSETKIVVRFWILSIIFSFISLFILQIH